MVRFSDEIPAPAVTVAEVKAPVKLAAARPAVEPATVIPADEVELKDKVEVWTSVAPVALTVMPVLAEAAAALVLAVTTMLRPSAAARATAPVAVLKVAVTPVCELIALTAAATCEPRCAPEVDAVSAPMLTPLIWMSPAAIAVAEVDAVPALVVEPTVATTPVAAVCALIAADCDTATACIGERHAVARCGADLYAVDRQVARCQCCGGDGTGACNGSRVARVGADAKRVRERAGDLADRDLIVGSAVRANLEVCTAKRTVEQVHAIEVGAGSDTVVFRQQLCCFIIQGSTVRGAVGAVGCLNGEVTHGLQVGSNLGQCTLSGLRQRDTIIRIARCLIETADLRGHPLCNCITRCIIGGAVDAQAGRQALHGCLQRRLRGT